MAKHDEFNFDDDDADFSFDGDDGEGDFSTDMTADDRNPVTRFAGGALSGLAGAAKDPERQRRLVKTALPPGYDTAYDAATGTVAGVKDLYDTVSQEVGVVMKDVKKGVNKVLPAVSGVLPKGISSRLKNWSEQREDSGTIDVEQAEIDSTLGSIFGSYQPGGGGGAPMPPNRDEGSSGASDMDDGGINPITAGKMAADIAGQIVNNKLGEQSNNLLVSISTGISKLVSYQDQVTIQFQKKSLELQYKQTFTTRKLLDVTEQFFAMSKDANEKIVKNTGLPDLVKVHSSELAMQQIKQKFLGDIIAPYTMNASEVGRRILDKTKGKTKEFFGDLGAAVSGGFTGAEIGVEAMSMGQEDLTEEEREARQRSGLAGGLADAAGGFVGTNIFDRGAFKAAKYMRENVFSDDKYAAQGMAFQNAMSQLPFLANTAFKNGTGIEILDKFLNFIGADEMAQGRNTTVQKSMMDELDKATHFDLQTKKTITDIIPQYLASMDDSLRRLQTKGKDTSGPRFFNFKTGKMEKLKDIVEKDREELTGKNQEESATEAAFGLLTVLDPENLLSDPMRKKILKWAISKAQSRETIEIEDMLSGNDAIEDPNDELLNHLSNQMGVEAEMFDGSEEAKKSIKRLMGDIRNPKSKQLMSLKTSLNDKVKELRSATYRFDELKGKAIKRAGMGSAYLGAVEQTGMVKFDSKTNTYEFEDGGFYDRVTDRAAAKRYVPPPPKEDDVEQHHTGGIVGAPGAKKVRNPFAGAPKYHTGGVVTGQKNLIRSKKTGYHIVESGNMMGSFYLVSPDGEFTEVFERSVTDKTSPEQLRKIMQFILDKNDVKVKQSGRVTMADFEDADDGLEENEVAAVLEEGEEVLTEDDPRHQSNFQRVLNKIKGFKGLATKEASLLKSSITDLFKKKVKGSKDFLNENPTVQNVKEKAKVKFESAKEKALKLKEEAKAKLEQLAAEAREREEAKRLEQANKPEVKPTATGPTPIDSPPPAPTKEEVNERFDSVEKLLNENSLDAPGGKGKKDRKGTLGVLDKHTKLLEDLVMLAKVIAVGSGAAATVGKLGDKIKGMDISLKGLKINLKERLPGRIANKIWDGGKDLIGKGYDKTKQGIGFGWELGKGVGRKVGSMVGSTFGWAKEKVSTNFDVFVKGMDQKLPVLEARLLKAGHYIDEKTGKIIKSIKDITGPVKDKEGNVVLTLEDFKKGFTNNRGMTILKGLSSRVGKLWDRMMQPVGFLKTMVGGFVGFVKDVVTAPYDVHVKGEETPRLLAYIFRQGGYRLKSSGKVLKHPNQITGEVIGVDDQVLITMADIQTGLVDNQGKPIKTLGQKVADIARMPIRALAWAGKKAVGALKGAYDFGSSLISSLGSKLFGGDSKGGFSIFSTQKQTVAKLEDIYTLLEERMPGGKKKVAGDRDGDGDVEGGLKDLKQDITADAEVKQKGRMASAWESFAGKFKRKDKEEKVKKEKEEGGGFLSGISGKMMFAKTAAMLGASLIGQQLIKAADGLTGGIATKALDGVSEGLGLGSVGKAVLGVGAGYAAYKGAAAGGKALLTKALPWAGRGLMMAAPAILSGIGTGLAAIGSVLLSAPVLIAVGVGLALYGAYKGYKYLTAKKAPILRFRMAQYGYDLDDEDEATVIMEMEAKLMAKTVCIKGKAATLSSGITVEELIEPFNIDKKDKDQLQRWVTWFSSRFKPVYLSHMTALYNQTGSKDLHDADNALGSVEKVRYLKSVHYNDQTTSPCLSMPGPFGSDDEVDLDAEDVQDEFDDAIEEAEDEDKESFNKRNNIVKPAEKTAPTTQSPNNTGGSLAIPPLPGGKTNTLLPNGANGNLANVLPGSAGVAATATGTGGPLVAYNGPMAAPAGAAGPMPATVQGAGGLKWSSKANANLFTDIAAAAAAHGVPEDYMKAMAYIESRGDPNAGNKSGAKGIYQFMPDTAREFGIAGREFDQAANIDAGARYAKGSLRSLTKFLGRAPEPWMLYMAHNQGFGGFQAIWRAAQAGKEVPRDIRGNMNSNGGVGLSPGQFIEMWKKKYNDVVSKMNGGAAPMAAPIPQGGSGASGGTPTPAPAPSPAAAAPAPAYTGPMARPAAAPAKAGGTTPSGTPTPAPAGPTTPATPDKTFYIGDSIAHGHRTANKAPGDTKVGRSPSQVLEVIEKLFKGDPNALRGKSVFLSSGLSNNPTDFGSIEKQLKLLSQIGARVTLAGVSNTYPKGDPKQMNAKLEELARKYGATFLGGFNAGNDKVHPKSYGGAGSTAATVRGQTTTPATPASNAPQAQVTAATQQPVPAKVTSSDMAAPAVSTPAYSGSMAATGTVPVGSRPQKMAAYATKHANGKSIGYCAKYVSNAMEHAGYKIGRGNADTYIERCLIPAGFKMIQWGSQPQIGDIVHWSRTPKHRYGHIQIWDGRNWVSDFIQNRIGVWRDPDGSRPSHWRDGQHLNGISGTSDVPSSMIQAPSSGIETKTAPADYGTSSPGQSTTSVDTMTQQSRNQEVARNAQMQNQQSFNANQRLQDGRSVAEMMAKQLVCLESIDRGIQMLVKNPGGIQQREITETEPPKPEQPKPRTNLPELMGERKPDPIDLSTA